MKTYLVTPFADKDRAKALGARWDPARKAWYVENVADLSAFSRWLPGAAGVSQTREVVSNSTGPVTTRQVPQASLVEAREVAAIAHCGCDALPWEDCIHTRPGP